MVENALGLLTEAEELSLLFVICKIGFLVATRIAEFSNRVDAKSHRVDEALCYLFNKRKVGCYGL